MSENGRPIEGGARASFHFYCKQADAFVSWKASEGLMERFGRGSTQWKVVESGASTCASTKSIR